MSQDKAMLVLEDGTFYEGEAYGAQGTSFGELVFTTGMTGYQETLTDPSYAGQIIVQTAPHIGNTGVNAEDEESRKIWVSGYVVRDAARRSSNWRSEKDLDQELKEQNIVGIKGIDTRALTRHLREKGALRAGIFSPAESGEYVHYLVDKVKASPFMSGAQWADKVSDEHHTIGSGKLKVVALDMGIKANTPRLLSEREIQVEVMPASTTFEEIKAMNPDGVFFSNGPGDPATADHQTEVLREVLRNKIPFFGICFGNQILGRALGFDTYKLKFGHRGINVPVKNTQTGLVEITSQNHGFAVDAPVGKAVTAPEKEFGKVEVSHVCLNDDVVEGLRCLDLPAYSVQFHPESAAGPHDSEYLFDDFVTLMQDNKKAAK